MNEIEYDRWLTDDPTTSISQSVFMRSNRKFDHENLEVYRVALEYVTWLSGLTNELRSSDFKYLSEPISQIDRAATSIVLNIAEGNGRRATKQRARFFDDARGSAAESAACLDILVARGAVTKNRTDPGKQFLFRIVSMLTKLVERFGESP